MYFYSLVLMPGLRSDLTIVTQNYNFFFTRTKYYTSSDKNIRHHLTKFLSDPTDIMSEITASSATLSVTMAIW